MKQLTKVSENKEGWLYWSGLFVWLSLIFYLSHQPSLPGLPDDFLDTLLKKSAHASAYAVLMSLWWGSLKSIRPASNRTLVLALALTVLYAISDEWHQTFIPHRSGQVGDVLIDAVGALFVFIFIRSQRNMKADL